MNSLYIILGIVGFIILVFILIYNGLISKKNQVEYAFSSIDVNLKKRHDLIPNLIAAVKEFMKHEEKLLVGITELRAQAMNPNISEGERLDAEGKLSSSLGALNVAVENYPDLKSNTNFLQLQASLNEVEEQISASRRAYNAAVMDYNNGLEMFPSNIVAGMMRYKRKESFEIPEMERANIDVKGLFNS